MLGGGFCGFVGIDLLAFRVLWLLGWLGCWVCLFGFRVCRVSGF